MTTKTDNQLLIESNFDVDSFTEDDPINESSQEKNWYIKGVFLQADVVNRNRRYYPHKIMESAVDKFDRLVESRQAVGELSHPDTLEINMDRITHRIVEIMREGKNYVGKALILNTDAGKVVKALLEGDVRIGVSSRGRGRTQKNNSGISVVGDNYMIEAIDSVFSPSAPDAFVEGIMENDQRFVSTVQADEEIMEHIRNDIRASKSGNLKESKSEVFQKFLDGVYKRYQP